jgi:hypothetical protein
VTQSPISNYLYISPQGKLYKEIERIKLQVGEYSALKSITTENDDIRLFTTQKPIPWIKVDVLTEEHRTRYKDVLLNYMLKTEATSISLMLCKMFNMFLEKRYCEIYTLLKEEYKPIRYVNSLRKIVELLSLDPLFTQLFNLIGFIDYKLIANWQFTLEEYTSASEAKDIVRLQKLVQSLNKLN